MGHYEDVLRHMQLTKEDLEANRAGALSERQKRAIVRSGINNLLGAVMVGLALAAILYFVSDKPLVPAQWITAGVLAAAALVFGLFDFRRTRRAATDGQVETLTGVVRVYSVRRAGWYLDIAGRTFRPPVHVQRLRNGAPYHVYVAPTASRIVALEPDGWD